ncbi:unnamed protein product [Prunus armeniaca]
MRSFPLGIFPKLTTLGIGYCDNLESLCLIEGVVLSHLNSLRVYNCPNLVCFPQGGLPTPNLTRLEFLECKKLKSLPERVHTLTALEKLQITNLPNLESIAEDGGLPPNLRDFSIDNCERLRASSSSVGDYCNWGLQALVSLEEFRIGGRGSDEILETLLKQQLLPTTLRSLWIEELSSLKSLDGKGLAHLTFLRSLSIIRCKSLEFLPGEALQHLTSLQKLYINACPSLQFLPEEGLPPSLSNLSIYNCSALEKRYQNKTGQDHWASISHIPCIKINGQHLLLENYCHNEGRRKGSPGNIPTDRHQMSHTFRLRASVGEHWDLQGLVSLEEFTIGGRGSDDILEMLLPSTLYILHINRLSSLKSLDRKGLKNITSLYFLSISKCFSREKRYKRRQEKIGPTYLTFLVSR